MDCCNWKECYMSLLKAYNKRGQEFKELQESCANLVQRYDELYGEFQEAINR